MHISNEKNTKITTNVLIDSEAREKLKNAILKLSKAVINTLGPNGSCAIINNGYERIRVTKDGVTVIKALTSEDKFEDTFLSLMKEAGEAVNEKSGDGTTTCILLMREIIVEGLKKISIGYSQKQILQIFSIALEKIIAHIKKQSIKPSSSDLKNVAIISANNDKQLGDLVYAAITKLGDISKHYLISVEESKSTETSLEFTEGIKIDSGYLSPYFVTNGEKKIEIHDVEILIINNKVTQQDFIVKFLEYLTIKNKAGIIICDEIEKNLLGTIIVNNYQKIVKVIAIKTPSSGNERLELLKDIAVLSNAKIYDFNNSCEEDIVFCSTYLGQCRKVIVTQKQTSFIDGNASKSDLDDRAKHIKELILELEKEGICSGMQVEKLYERYSMLKGGVAIIKVGGDTEIEIGEKKDRVLDAVSAAKAGKNGILPGGGVALFRTAIYLENEILPTLENEIAIISYKLLINALKKPIHQILINSGKEEEIALILQSIKESKKQSYGYDALNYKLCDLRECGVVDATESILQVLNSAITISKIGLSLTSVIVNRNTNDTMGRQM